MTYPSLRDAIVGVTKTAYDWGAQGRTITNADIDIWTRLLSACPTPLTARLNEAIAANATTGAASSVFPVLLYVKDGTPPL